MNIEVRYYSRGGNTEKVARAIAQAAGVKARGYDAPLGGTTDLLFLGGSVYGFGLDEHTTSYIAQLEPKQVKAVALFGTSAVVKSGNGAMTGLLRDKGIKVLEPTFHCWGAFTVMHRGHPNAADLARAADFAREALKKAQ